MISNKRTLKFILRSLEYILPGYIWVSYDLTWTASAMFIPEVKLGFFSFEID